MDVPAIILFVVILGAGCAAWPKVWRGFRGETPVEPPPPSWPFSDTAWRNLERGFPTAYVTYLFALTPILAFEGFDLYRHAFFFDLGRVFGFLLFWGSVVAAFVAATGLPEFLVPRPLRSGALADETETGIDS